MHMRIVPTSLFRSLAAWCGLLASLSFHCGDDGSEPAQSKPDAGHIVQSDSGQPTPDSGRPECQTNADCKDSEAAVKARDLKCLVPEVYCLEHACKSGCAANCTVARADVNPCMQGLCAHSPYPVTKDMNFCTMLPVACDSSMDCPKYLPPAASGESAAWSCEDSVCRYPGFEYATQ